MLLRLLLLLVLFCVRFCPLQQSSGHPLGAVLLNSGAKHAEPHIGHLHALVLLQLLP